MPRSHLLLPSLFLLFALPLLGFLSLSVPTGESPDEVAHAVRMESLRYGDIVGHRGVRLDGLGQQVPDSGVTAHLALLLAGFSFNPGAPLASRVMTRARENELEAVPWDKAPTFISVPNTAVYSPLFYVPGALAMQAAKWLHYGPWQTFLAGRLANALSYAAVGLAALLLARRAQGLLFAVLLLPISLWMAASCSQDGLVIGSAALGAALLTRGTMASWWAGAAAVGLLAVAKPLYLPLAGIVLVLLPRRGPWPRLRISGALLAAAPALVWYAAANHYAVVPFVRGAYAAGPNWPGEANRMFGVVDASLQIQVFLHQPLLMLTMPAEAMMDKAKYLLLEMVGIVGVLDIFLPNALYALWFVALAAMLPAESLSKFRWPEGPGIWARLGVFACIAAAVFAVFDGQYLSWDFIGAAEINGVQGRYLVPLLPFLGLALPRLVVTGGLFGRWALRAPAIAAGLAGLVVIPQLVVATYYLH